MKLTLIGYGFVGKAMYHVLNKWHDIKIVDPEYTIEEIENDFRVSSTINLSLLIAAIHFSFLI